MSTRASLLCALLCAVLIFAAAAPADAFVVNFQPGGYTGVYRVNGGPSFTGPGSADLTAGTYELGFGGFSTYTAAAEGAGFVRFTIDGTGNVSAITNAVTGGPSLAATASGNTITFSTVPVTIDPGAYAGAWVTAPHSPSSAFTGLRALTLVRELSYELGVPGFETVTAAGANGATFFVFSVDAAGQVSAVLNQVTRAPSQAATASGSTLTLRNATITIDPVGYTGAYTTIAHRTVAVFQGPRALVFVPELTYFVDVNGGFDRYTPGGASGATFFAVSVDAAGQIATVLNVVSQTTSAAATASGTTLTLNNAPITFVTGAYAGRYVLTSHRTFGPVLIQGPHTFTMVPDLSYQIDLASGAFEIYPAGGPNGATFARFTVTPTGQISAYSVFNHPIAAFTALGASLVFTPVAVTVDPTTYAGVFEISGYPGLTGVTTLELLPGLAAVLRTTPSAEQRQVFVEPSQVTPASVLLHVDGGQAHTFLFSLGLPPVANAGSDQTVDENTTVALDGSGSTAGVSYAWTQIGGPAVTLDVADPARPQFLAPPVSFGGATLTFQLVVSKGGLTSEPDTVNITVANVNHAPVANAVAPFTNVSEGAAVGLDGSDSYDPDGDALVSYAWTQVGVPTVTLSDPASATPTFQAPAVTVDTTLTFRLVVRDGVAVSAPDEVTVTVRNVNHQPVASAAAVPGTVTEGSAVTLTAQGSADADGDAITFAWTQTAGPPVALSANDVANPTLTAPAVASTETLLFELRVSDGALVSEPAAVAVTVLNLNRPVSCTAAVPSVGRLWPPDHKLIPVTIAGVTDPDNDTVTITVTGVTQDEPVNGLGDGDTSPDAVVQGGRVLLRAERAGNGNGRIYRVQFTAADGQGSTCSGSVAVGVPKSMKANQPITDDGQSYVSTTP